MTEQRTGSAGSAGAEAVAVDRARDEAVERALGRAFAIGLPLAAVGGAIVAGLVASLGSALLVLATGALVGAIGLLWASVRTLTGDAPLSEDFRRLGAYRHGVDALAEEKTHLLRALKDIESEHLLGKIDDADYESFVTRYRDEAKAIMRKMDVEVAPLRERAERLAQDYLKKSALEAAPEPKGPATEGRSRRAAGRVTCGACSASNEPDATFCKQCGSSLKEDGRAPT
jgi:hypothetical protein